MKLNSENLNINLRHLRAIRAVQEQGSFARAAVELGVVPSALTETVRQVEEALGAPLFDRSIRPPLATPLALDLLQEVSPLLDGMDSAITRIRANAGLESGVLSIGAAPSAISYLVAPALARFRASYPAIRYRLHDDVAERLADLVVDGTLDIAIAGQARSRPELRQTFLTEDRFGLACCVSDPIAAAASVSIGSVDSARIITLHPGTGTYQLLANCDGLPAGLREGTMQAYSTVAQLCMIRAGLGVGLMPENAVSLFNDPTIRFLPLNDLDLRRRLHLLEPARRGRSHVAKAFVDELMQ